MSIPAKIKERMDNLQNMMESNNHIDNKNNALDAVSLITKFWQALSEEDKDYVQAAQHAIEEQTPWNI